MNPALLASAIAIADFLYPYSEAHGFDLTVSGPKVEISYCGSEYVIDMNDPKPHVKALEVALTFSDTSLDKRATVADFRMFADRENFLDNLPKENVGDEEEDSEPETGITNYERNMIRAFRGVK